MLKNDVVRSSGEVQREIKVEKGDTSADTSMELNPAVWLSPIKVELDDESNNKFEEISDPLKFGFTNPVKEENFDVIKKEDI